MKYSTLLTALLFISAAAESQTELQTKNVIIFKNEQAFIIKDGVVSTPNGKFILNKNIPKAKFGTLWFSSNNGSIKRISGFTDSVDTQIDVMSVSSLLSANKGSVATVSVLEGNTFGKYTGTIKDVKTMTADQFYNYYNNGVLLLQTETETKAINMVDVKAIDFKTPPIQKLTIKKEEQQLAVDFREAKPTQQLKMMYLEDGIGWKPVYILELNNDKKGKLTLNAETINRGSKLENTDLSFVVGSPNFKYAGSLSSLVSRIGDLNNFISYNPSFSVDDEITPKTSFRGARSDGMEAISDEQLPPEGSTIEDFYIYKIKNVSLPAKSSASFELQKGDIDLEHIFKSNLNANSATDWTYSGNYYFDDAKNISTFHTLKIKNNLNAPLTEGAVLVVNNEDGNTNPIAQDLIEYTPVKGESYVNLTLAQDIKTEHKESESGRKENARRTKDAAWDLVTISGEIKITNYGQKDIKMNVKRWLNGKPGKSDVQWKVDPKTINNGLNPTNEITWEFSLNKGEEKIIKYTYDVYLRLNI